MQSKEGSVKSNAVKNAQYDFLLIEGPGLVKVSIFDREIALSARGPTSGSYCCCCVVVRTFVLIELYDAILL